VHGYNYGECVNMNTVAAGFELIRLMALAAALLAGLGVAMGLRSILQRGDGHGSRRFVVAMLAASGFIACAAWVFVAAMRIAAGAASGPGGGADSLAAFPASFAATLAIYAGIGFFAGLAAGMFPLAAGVPLVVLTGLATGLAVISIAPWVPWVDGQEAASLSLFPVMEEGSTCVLKTIESDGGRRERSLSLPPGPIAVEFSILSMQGPVLPAFGEKRYRLEAILIGSSRVSVLQENVMLATLKRNGILARVLGCKVTAIQTALFEPSDFGVAVFSLLNDGTIGMMVK